MIKHGVKINGHYIGEELYGVESVLETYPIIAIPKASHKKIVVPQRFVPIYKKSKVEIEHGAMTLIINTYENPYRVSGGIGVWQDNIINPLSHVDVIVVEFDEEGGILYKCLLAKIDVENIGGQSGVTKYIIDLDIESIGIKGGG